MWVVVIALTTACVGCKTGQDQSITPMSNERRVSVATIGWNAFSEQNELAILLKTNGIEAALDGSKLLDIVVPQSQANKAWALLETNQLVLEKKVFLSRPPK